MMERLEQLMEQGRMAKVQELFLKINRLMENLQIPNGHSGREPQQGQGGGQQQMEDFSIACDNTRTYQIIPFVSCKTLAQTVTIARVQELGLQMKMDSLLCSKSN